MIRIVLLIFLALYFTGCINKHGISAQYYSKCQEYYDLQGFYHKKCGEDDIVTFKELGDSLKVKKEPSGNVW